MKKEIQEEIKNISPDFPIPKAAESRDLPDEYFAEFQEKVIAQVGGQRMEHHPRRINWYRTIRNVAAVLLIGICGWVVIQQLIGDREHENMALTLTKEDALAYALDYPDEMNSAILELGDELEVSALFSPDELDTYDPEVLDQILEEMTLQELEEIL
jgi:hypothetical protein